MKYFLAATLLWSLHAQAQSAPECPSIWVYKTCSIPDKSHPSSWSPVIEWSPELEGGQDQFKVCQNVRDNYNKAHGVESELNKPAPVDEQRDSKRKGKNIGKGWGKVKYKYACELRVPVYADPSACEKDNRWSSQVGGPPPPNSGCLSCEHLAKAPAEEMVKCLKTNISEIIMTKAVEVRPSDEDAVKAQIKRMFLFRDYTTIKNLQSPEDLQFFVEYLKK